MGTLKHIILLWRYKATQEKITNLTSKREKLKQKQASLTKKAELLRERLEKILKV